MPTKQRTPIAVTGVLPGWFGLYSYDGRYVRYFCLGALRTLCMARDFIELGFSWNGLFSGKQGRSGNRKPSQRESSGPGGALGATVQQFGPALFLRPSALPMKRAKCEMHPFRLALFGKIGKIWGNCRRGIESTRRVKPNVWHLGARTMVGYTVNGNERACRAVVGSGPVKREAGTWAETSR